MKYIGKITNCEFSTINDLVKIKYWVTLDILKTVVIEETGTIENIALKFDLKRLKKSFAVDNFIGRKCKIKFNKQLYTFISFIK